MRKQLIGKQLIGRGIMNLGIVGLAILLLLATACTVRERDITAYATKSPQQLDGEVVIGAILDVTGASARYSENVQNGLELARQEVNRVGGINDKELKILIEDERCDQKIGMSAAQKLITQDHVSVIIGPICSSTSMAIAPIAEQAKVIMITPVSSVPALKYAGDYIFRNRESGDIHSIKVAEFAYQELGARTAAVLYINLDNGLAYKDIFKKHFEELGGRIVAEETYEKGALDFRTQLLKIKASKADVLYLAGQAHEEAVKQVKEFGMTQQVLGPITMESPELINIAGDAAEGIIYSYPSFSPDSKEQHIAEYAKKYEARYGKKSEAFAANGYDIVMMISNALRRCGESTDCIKGYLYALKNYPGVSGTTTFDEYGEVNKPLMMKTVKNGRYSTYVPKWEDKDGDKR